jgi:hypothetical protein
VTVPLILLTMTALQPLSCIVLTGRVTVYLSYVTNTLSCFYCHCDDLKTPESKGRRITRQTEIETMCVEDVWGGGGVRHDRQFKKYITCNFPAAIGLQFGGCKGLTCSVVFSPLMML